MTTARILVVEDQDDIARTIQTYLEALGYTPCGRASSGEDAIQLAIQQQPDLVLMDIQLAGNMDGIQAAQRIRTQINIPVVFLTVHADESTLQRAKVTQPFGYLLKPFEQRELHSTIGIALYKHAADAERERLIVELQDALAHIKTLHGLLPICMHCKRIRNDDGYWQQLEDYIRQHSEAEFSHGLCPSCARQLYPQVFQDTDEP